MALEHAKETYFYTTRYDEVFQYMQSKWSMSEMHEARQRYHDVEKTQKKQVPLPTESKARIAMLRELARTRKPLVTIHQYIKYLSVIAEVTKCIALYEIQDAPMHVKRLKTLYFSDMYRSYRESLKKEEQRPSDSTFHQERIETDNCDTVLPGLEGLPRLERPSSFRKVKVNIADFLMPGSHETRKLREDRVCGTLFMLDEHDEDENYVFMVDSSIFSKRDGKFFNVQVEGSDCANRMGEEELIELLAQSFQLLVGNFQNNPFE